MSLEINSIITLIPICLAIIAAFTYFFGRIIGDIQQPGNYAEHVYYFKGVNFIFTNIVFPYLVFHIIVVKFGLYENTLRSKELIMPLFTILILLMLILILYISSKFKELDRINPHITFFKKECCPLIILVFSIMVAGISYFLGYINYCIFVNSQNSELLVSGSVFLLGSTLAIYIILAFLDGLSSAEYPFVKIILKNGQPFSGNVMSFGEFVTLVTEDKTYNINKDEICLIVQSEDNNNGDSLEESNDQKDQCKLITE